VHARLRIRRYRRIVKFYDLRARLERLSGVKQKFPESNTEGHRENREEIHDAPHNNLILRGSLCLSVFSVLKILGFSVS
jgi:hypothetical protein